MNSEVIVGDPGEAMAPVVHREHAIARLRESRRHGAELQCTTGRTVSPHEGSALFVAPLEVVHPDPVDRDEPAMGSLVVVPQGRDGRICCSHPRRVDCLRDKR